MTRHRGVLPPWAGLTLLLLACAFLLPGCGEDEESPVVPVEGNPFEGATVGTDDTLDVVTWNLETFAKAGATTADLVIDAVLAMDVDIVALEEIESSTYFNEVKNGLSGYAGFRASTAGYGINIAFLYRVGETLEVTAIREIMTEPEYDSAFPRHPLVLECRYRGVELAVIANHLKAQESGDDNLIDLDNEWDNETRRYNACVFLAEYVAEDLADKAVIILGDMNDSLTDPSDGDVFAVFKNDPDRWLFVDMPIAEDPEALWSYPGWPSHLDHILIDSHLFANYRGLIQPAQVVPLHEYLDGGWATYDKNISDHLPVAVNLLF